jgi:hypothetical protein
MAADIHALVEDADENNRLSGFPVYDVMGLIVDVEIGLCEPRNTPAVTLTFAD